VIQPGVVALLPSVGHGFFFNNKTKTAVVRDYLLDSSGSRHGPTSSPTAYPYFMIDM
jgi:hypothetical protein